MSPFATYLTLFWAAILRVLATEGTFRREPPSQEATSEGTVPFFVRGERFETYYKVFGSLHGSPPPLVVVHGGPGLTHNYLNPFADLHLRDPKQPVVFYDQLGNGRSSHLKEKPAEFFSVHLYVKELANLIRRLGIGDYHVLGHSWGGPLVAELSLANFRPRGLKSIVISNSLTSMELVGKSIGERVDEMENADEIKKGMGMRNQNLTAYLEAMGKFYSRYGFRHVDEKPFPKDLQILDVVYGNPETGEQGDPTVNDNMEPVTASWNITDRVHRIQAPTLVITGEDDFLQKYCAEGYIKGIWRSQWKHFENSSHVPFWEEREKYMALITEWMERVNDSEDCDAQQDGAAGTWDENDGH